MNNRGYFKNHVGGGSNGFGNKGAFDNLKYKQGEINFLIKIWRKVKIFSLESICAVRFFPNPPHRVGSIRYRGRSRREKGSEEIGDRAGER